MHVELLAWRSQKNSKLKSIFTLPLKLEKKNSPNPMSLIWLMISAIVQRLLKTPDLRFFTSFRKNFESRAPLWSLKRWLWDGILWNPRGIVIPSTKSQIPEMKIIWGFSSPEIENFHFRRLRIFENLGIFSVGWDIPSKSSGS